MKNSKLLDMKDLEKPLSKKEKIILGIVLLTPMWILGGVELLGDHYKKHPDPINSTKFVYDYELRKDEPSKVIPKFGPGDHLVKKSNSGGVVLQIKGMTVNTGLTEDEILQELNLDYQDLFDYYGGSEEIYH